MAVTLVTVTTTYQQVATGPAQIVPVIQPVTAPGNALYVNTSNTDDTLARKFVPNQINSEIRQNDSVATYVKADAVGWTVLVTDAGSGEIGKGGGGAGGGSVNPTTGAMLTQETNQPRFGPLRQTVVNETNLGPGTFTYNVDMFGYNNGVSFSIEIADADGQIDVTFLATNEADPGTATVLKDVTKRGIFSDNSQGNASVQTINVTVEETVEFPSNPGFRWYVVQVVTTGATNSVRVDSYQGAQ